MRVRDGGQFLTNAIDFMSKYQAKREPRLPVEKIHRVDAGLNHGDFVLALL